MLAKNFSFYSMCLLFNSHFILFLLLNTSFYETLHDVCLKRKNSQKMTNWMPFFLPFSHALYASDCLPRGNQMNCGKIDAPQNTPVVTWIKTLSTIISKTSLISFWRSSFHHSQITQQALGNLETKSDHIGIPSVIFIHSWYQISRSIWYFQVMFHNHKPIYSKA